MARLAGLIFMLAWMLGLGAVHLRVSDEIITVNANRQDFVPPPLAELNPQIVNLITLGHRGVYDDFVHLWFNHYLVDTPWVKAHPDQAEKIGNLALRLRPAIETSYMLMCTVFISDMDRPEYCEPIIQTGMRIFPQSFMLPMTQGYVHYKIFERPGRAAAYYAIAAQSKQAPPYVTRVAKKLMAEEPLTDAEVEQLRQDFKNMWTDDAIKQLMREQQEQ